MSLRLWRRDDGRSSNWLIIGTVPVWRDGKRRNLRVNQKSTGTSDRGEAEGILIQVASALQRGNITNGEAPQPFSDLVIAYYNAGKSRRYLDRITQAIGPVPVTSITQALIDAEGRKAYPNVKAPTLRRQWHGPIIAVLNHSKVRLDLERPEASRKTTRWCTPAQADAIVKQCAAGRYRDPWAPAMAEFLFGTGCRADEAFTLQTHDLSIEYGTAVIRDPKNGHERTVLLPQRCVAALSRLPNVGKPGAVFRKPGGQEYAPKTANEGRSLTFLRSAAARAGVPVFNPHMTRHSWATWFHVQTKDQLRLRELGGWRTASAMERYTHTVPRKVGEDAIALGWDFREGMDLPATEAHPQSWAAVARG